MRNFFEKIFPPLFALTCVFVALELFVFFRWLDSSLVPSPSQVFLSYFSDSDLYLEAVKNTFIHSLWGYLGALLSGLILAVGMSFSRWLRDATLPLAVFFQTVPVIAVAPVIVIYLGFGPPTVIFCSSLVAVFPIIASTLMGLSNFSSGFSELMEIYKVPLWRRFVFFQVPHAVPSILSGMKISAGLSVIGVVAGEFVAGGGLGALIDVARTQQKLELVYGSLLLLALVGLGLLLVVSGLERIICFWRPLGAPFRK
jgi:NitT/TauT family transport system permease protein